MFFGFQKLSKFTSFGFLSSGHKSFLQFLSILFNFQNSLWTVFYESF